VIEVDPGERSGGSRSGHAAGAWSGRHPSALADDEVRGLLLESGEWTAIRTRPFGRVGNPEARPHAIFVTAMDTAPLAPDPVAAVAGRETDLEWGLAAAARLTDGPVFVCSRAGRRLPAEEKDRVRHEEFTGPHPAGTPGLHIHRLAPVGRGREAWHLDAQDLASIGSLFRTGAGDPFRVVALGGPPLRRPALLRVPIGAALDGFADPDLEVTAGPVERRVISGSLLSGRAASGDVTGYLGRYHRQVTVLEEDRRRRLLGWLAPGAGAVSVSRAYLSSLLPARARDLTTGTNGSRRAIVPIGTYDKVMAFDIPAPMLLRALLMEDIERAEELGALELIEEDVGLLTFACPAKNDYGPALRRVLDTLEKEG
jgi:Na+-transporting NADH:ubiquinone oxidoreductase subunit A